MLNGEERVARRPGAELVAVVPSAGVNGLVSLVQVIRRRLIRAPFL